MHESRWLSALGLQQPGPAPDIVTLPKKRSGVLPGPVSIVESSEA